MKTALRESAMCFFSALLFGISASLDALVVGISYGIRRIRMGWGQNLFISFVTLIGTCLSMGFGVLLLPLLPPFLGKSAGSLILILLGIYYIIKYMLQKYRKRKKTAPGEIKTCLSLPEAFLLGLALSVNNMGIGLSASLAGLALWPAAAATFFCSVVFLLLGHRLGKCSLFYPVQHTAQLLSGGLLILLGALGL